MSAKNRTKREALKKIKGFKKIILHDATNTSHLSSLICDSRRKAPSAEFYSTIGKNILASKTVFSPIQIATQTHPHATYTYTYREGKNDEKTRGDF